jgi:hypothetical protein
MRLQTRLGRAEGAALKASASDRPRPLTPAEWLEQFEAWGREGAFPAEPDYPMALAAYRNALQNARADAGSGEERAALLARCQGRFRHVEPRPREVEASWQWLAEMSQRSLHGIPPVTEAEFRDLAAWFTENGDRLERLALPARWFDLGGGRLTSAAKLRYELARGPRAFGAGAAADKVRRLKALYGEGRL